MKKNLKEGRKLVKIAQTKLPKKKNPSALTLRQEIANLRAELAKEREEKNKLLSDYKKQLTTAKSKITKLEKLVVKKPSRLPADTVSSLVKKPPARKTVSLRKPKLTKPQKL